MLLVGMLQEFRRDSLRMDSGSHEIVPLVAQHANDLGRQRFVQDLVHRLSIGLVAFGYRALLVVLTSSFPLRFAVGRKWFLSHAVTFLQFQIGGRQPSILLVLAK